MTTVWRDARTGNPLKEAISAGTVLAGSFVRILGAESVEVCAAAGADFVIIDNEHQAFPDDGVSFVRAAEAAGTTPIIRTFNSNRETITRALDTGAWGAMVPQIRSLEQARAALDATRYLDGARGLAGNRATGFGLRIPAAEYVAAADQNTFVVLQVEERGGLAAVEEIAALPGYDVLFVGTSDMSVALGRPGDLANPELLDALRRVRDAAIGNGKALGLPVGSVEMAERYIEFGARFVATGDVGLLAGAARTFFAGVRACSA